MKALDSNRGRTAAIAVAVLSVVLLAGLAGDAVQASNMGFKHHKQIFPKDGGFPNGENLVALPFRNPYMTSADICSALGLAPSPNGIVLQINADAGTTASNAPGCGIGSFALTPRVGIVVRNGAAATSGMLVGSHQGNPPGNVTLYKSIGEAFPNGQNDFPVPYHTTSVDSEDVCSDLGLPGGTRVLRRDADGGTTGSHTCGTGHLPVGFALRLGESVRIDLLGAVINVPPGRPAHF